MYFVSYERTPRRQSTLRNGPRGRRCRTRRWSALPSCSFTLPGFRSSANSPRQAGAPSNVASLAACHEETLDSIDRTRVVLKGPLATPIGEGGKSANVTLRKMFETFANIRPARELPGDPQSLRRPWSGSGGCPGERRRSLRRHRALANTECCPMLEIGISARLPSYRACRTGVGASRGPFARDGGHQGKHHEVDRGHVQAPVRAGRTRLSATSRPTTCSSTTALIRW